MKVNLEKTIVGAEEVEFLGFRISGLGIRRCPKKLAVLKRMKVLKTKKDLRSFIGSVTYLKENIPYYAEILKPLTMMLPSKAKFVWSKEAETAAK
ncbi:Transposon Ty3-I Gag-Pol polyprotein, partial [Aduncisulcus paluster]